VEGLHTFRFPQGEGGTIKAPFVWAGRATSPPPRPPSFRLDVGPGGTVSSLPALLFAERKRGLLHVHDMGNIFSNWG